MGQKPQRDPVNPKLIMRILRSTLPEVGGKEKFLYDTMNALWVYSDNYIPKEELESGRVHFWGTVSYSQLAWYMRVNESTAKRRLNAVKDRWGLVDWHRTKYGIKFEVILEVAPNPVGADDPSQLTPEVNLGEPRGTESGRLGGVENPSQGVRESSQGANSPSQGVQTPPSVFDLSLSVLKEPVPLSNDIFSLDEKDQPQTPNAKANATGGKPPVPPQTKTQTKDSARAAYYLWGGYGPQCSVHGHKKEELDVDCPVCHKLLHPTSIAEYAKHEKAKKAARISFAPTRFDEDDL